MVNFGRTAIFLIVAVLVGESRAADITVRVDRDPVPINESFVLSYRATRTPDGNPDFSPLEQRFDILNQHQSSSTQLASGVLSVNTEWRLELMARTVGTVTVPPIAFGRDRSPEITVTFKEATGGGSTQQGADLFLEVEVSPEEAFVQGQILYTVRVFQAVSIAEPRLSSLQVDDPDAVIESVTDNVRYRVNRDNREYNVTMLRYAIFPQHSGTLTIDPLALTARVFDRQWSGQSIYSAPSRRRIVRSDSVEVTVKPVPAEASGDPWIPASAVNMTEVWSEDPPIFRVGEPVTRTIAVFADGVTAEQLPQIEPSLPVNVRQYPSPPETQNRVTNDGYTGVRWDEYAIVPAEPGPMVLPPVKLAWWNVNENRMETASLPGRTIEVLPGVGRQASAPPVMDPIVVDAPAEGTAPVIRQTSARDESWYVTYGFALLLGVGWFITAFAWWSDRRRSRREGTKDDSAEAANLRAAASKVREACRKNDAEATKTALIAWAKTRWTVHPPLNLDALAARLGADFKMETDHLSAVLYGRSGSDWSGKDLWQAFKTAKPQEDRHRRKRTAGLAPLHPKLEA